MKLSSKALACGQSPMRKFHPYAVAAAAAGKKIYHLNIGQPDIHTPDALYDAIHNFRTPVLAYAASPGIPELIEAIRKYYENIGVGLDESDILITTGGSEALQIAANCLLDDGDEVIIPEPYYPNYTTFVHAAGGVIRDAEYGADITLRVAFPAGAAETFQLRLTELSAGSLTMTAAGEEFLPGPREEAN